MPSSSGGRPRLLRSRLEPLAPRPSSPRPAPPAPPAPPSPGRGPFFLQAPASGRTSSSANATRHVLEVLMATAAPARRPGETIALRRPRGRRVVAPRRRDAREPAAIEAHDVDLRRARPRRAEGEAPPVGRPRRRHVDGPVVGEPLEGLPAAVEEVDIGVAALLARHEELRAVG